MIFSRGRGSTGRHSDSGRGGRHARDRRAGDPGRDEQLGVDDEPDESAAAEPRFGPYDISAAPDDQTDHLDLGALRIPKVPDVQIQLQAGPQGDVKQVLLSHRGSRLQLAVFAAPRTEGIWDEVRANLLTSLTSGGSRPREVTGDYGVEVHAQVKQGSTMADVRHVGIDGPRWFVHGVFLGAAAVDPDKAGPLREVLRGLVVDRGTQAMPVSEALPLRLPQEAAAQLAEASQDPREP